MLDPVRTIWWKRQLAAYAKKHGIATGKGFNPNTPVMGDAARALLRQVQRLAGLEVTGTFDGATRDLLRGIHRDLVIAKGSLGIDISNNNGYVDWERVAAAGVKFAYLKVSEGASFVDGFYEKNRAGCEKNGIPYGGYAFLHPNDPPASQAMNFVEHLGHRKGMLPPCLDWEGPGADNPANQPKLKGMAWAVQQATNVTPILYGSYYSFAPLGVPEFSFLSACRLWIAAYPGPPKTPPPWTSVLLHQHTDKGRIDGVKGDVDLDSTLRDWTIPR